MVAIDLSNQTQASLDISFGCLVTVLNLFEIMVLSRLKRRCSNYEVVLFSLSIADLLYGLSNISIGVAFFTSSINEEVFEITTTTSFFFVLTSILHLSWIGIDRLWAVYSPMRHNYLITRKVVAIVLCLTWFSTIIVSLFLILRDELIIEKQQASKSVSINETVVEHLARYEEYMNVTLSSFIVGANIVFVVVYGALIHTILKHKKKKEAMKMTQSSKPDIKKHLKIGGVGVGNVKISATAPVTSRETDIAITCALITVSFVCFTLPYAISVFVSDSEKSITLTTLLLQLNSGVNCVVYFLRTKTTRWCENRNKLRLMNKNKKNATILRNMETMTPKEDRKINNNTNLIVPVVVNNNSNNNRCSSSPSLTTKMMTVGDVTITTPVGNDAVIIANENTGYQE